MNLEQVMLLSDEELIATAKRITGRDKNETHETLLGLPMYFIWDPVHDISAAWELFALIPIPCGIERGYEKAYGIGPIGTHVGFGALHPGHDEDDVWAETV